MSLRSNELLGALVWAAVIFTNFPGAFSISRSDVIARAQTWVDAGVPYSQSTYKDTYRNDCSGYVSMAWQLSTNYDTNKLSDITTSISKEDLAAGDILLRKGAHVTIFSSWVDSTKTKYWGFEESSSKGAVYRQIPYSYFDNRDKYLPRKYKNIQ